LKYANQINLALAVVGVVVVLYALSATFLAPSPSATLNIEQLVREGSTRVEARPPSTDLAPVMRNSTTTAGGGIVGIPEASSTGVVGVPGRSVQPSGASNPRRSLPGGSRELPSTRAVRIGSAPNTGPGSRAPGAGPGSVNQDPDDQGSSSYNRAQPTWNRQRPPAGAESAKRGTNDGNTPTPPTRSSMPVQQRRP
jgi:hypothetical protein